MEMVNKVNGNKRNLDGYIRKSIEQTYLFKILGQYFKNLDFFCLIFYKNIKEID